jgi:hypothetical protein
MANKNKAAISVDGADLDDVNTAVKNTAPTEVPHGFHNLYNLSIKYLVVKAPKNCADVYMISFLISAGASGLEAEAIKKNPARTSIKKDGNSLYDLLRINLCTETIPKISIIRQVGRRNFCDV